MTDIKRVLAYSTLSQLGLMFTALGLGAPVFAMFHLVTHAFFKALLFLGAGSVIHATHQQEMSHIGGLRRVMPLTWVTFLIATLAMSGVPLLSGFWSKDAILLEAQHRAPWVFWCLAFGAVMTAGYIFRLYLRCFHGAQPHEAPAHQAGEHHPHESPLIMTLPLVVLSAGAAFVGLLGSPFGGHWLLHLLGAPEVHEGVELMMVGLSALIVVVGALGAWRITCDRAGTNLAGEEVTRAAGRAAKRRAMLPRALQPLGNGIYNLASHKYYVDELYDRVIIQPFLSATRALSNFDGRIIDGAVDRAGLAGWSIGQMKAWIDQHIVDRIVNGVGEAASALSAAGRRLQTGQIQHYLFVIVIAVVLLAVRGRWW
jgi:NADH-quinone oxidoreductase subunit L